MSESENKKVQDILREVAAGDYAGDIIAMLRKLRQSLQLIGKFTYTDDFADSLNEIARRIDQQSVVEVQVPPKHKPEPNSDQLEPGRPSKIGTMKIGIEVDTTQVDEAIEKIRELGGMMTEHNGVTTELDALPMPAIIDVHDCIIEVHVYGSDDDQD